MSHKVSATSSIVDTKVLSKPDAALRVEKLVLSKAAIRGLTTDVDKIETFGERSKTGVPTAAVQTT